MNKLIRKPVEFLAGLAVLVTPLWAGNALVNPGFEADAPGEHQNLVGWTPYGPNYYNQSGSGVRHGVNALKVFSGFTRSVNYSGVYQDIPAGPGSTCSAEGWVKISSANLPAGQNRAWIEVTFRDAADSMLALHRSRVIQSGDIRAGVFPQEVWLELPVTNQYDPGTYTITGSARMLVAPAGSTRVRYQVVFEGDAANSAGAVYFDDLNLNMARVVPAPPAGPEVEAAEPAEESPGEWSLIWSDEFNQPDGSSPDASKWGYDRGGSGWGNEELEYYTDRTNNARIEDGKLVIEARQENFQGKKYTSARMLTKDKCAWAYGRIEARIQIPRGPGIWPAFWMLGANIDSVPWPTCGEIDIMENIGREPGTVHGTVHGPGYCGAGGIGGPAALPGGAAFADGFHVFGVEWETNRIRWYLDGKPYFALTPSKLPAGRRWVYTQPQFLLLNLAVGGRWPGNPDVTTTFPQRLTVDYVRVYKKFLPPDRPTTSKIPN